MTTQHTPFQYLKDVWEEKQRQLANAVAEKHIDSLSWLFKNIPAKQQIASASMSGILFLANPNVMALPLPPLEIPEHTGEEIGEHMFVIADLSGMLPETVSALSPLQEAQITKYFSAAYGFAVKAEMNGKRLNRNYGYIGQEQHLVRFQGDTMATHFDTPEDAAQFGAQGMAPGRSAWGYFVPFGQTMTREDSDREKYYIAVQTFLAPGFMNNVGEYYDFFKYKKMLVVNPQNGRAIVTVIGDAGPASWTGKHLGGSPEVMQYLERVDGKQKGSVLYFFIDDPENKVPLGPVEKVS
jgi:hypothetical protein